MIVASWNVNSITARLPQVLSWIARVRPHLLCLQETKVVDDKFPVKEFEQLGFTVETFGEKTYNGVALISRKPLSCVSKGFDQEVPPGSRRLIAGVYDEVKVIDVYVPNGSEVGSEKYAYKLEWLAALRKFLDDHYDPGEHVIICGDFNIAPLDIDVYDPAALSGSILVSDRERQALERIREWGFVDAFRQHHDGGGLYTWWDYRMDAFRKNMGLRIDHLWCTESLAARCKSIYIDKDSRKEERPSDHAPVVAEFALAG